jgi:hypothetical protein
LDECNVCNIYISYGGIKPSYPYGGCDCDGVLDGTSITDNCGVCDDDITNNCLMDCNIVWGGTAEEDECGVCEGDNSTCVDCAGTPNGNLVLDCGGICGGNSLIDSCGVCGGDDTSCQTGCTDENACNYDYTVDPSNDDGSCNFAAPYYDCDGNCSTTFDCNGDCGGTASIDCSGECSEGDTGVIAYTICDCFNTDADNFWCTKDYEEISCESYFDNCEDECLAGSGAAAVFNNPCGSQIGNNSICDPSCSDDAYADETTCIDNDENWSIHYLNTGCEVWGCVDETAVNYDSNANNCEDGTNSCCTYAEVTLSFGEITSSTIEIFMQNLEAVGGFQFDLTGGSALSGNASGGSSSDYGFSVNSGGTLVFGFSLTGSSIPIGSGLLTIVDASLVSEPICIDNIVISDASGGNLDISTNPICSE